MSFPDLHFFQTMTSHLTGDMLKEVFMAMSTRFLVNSKVAKLKPKVNGEPDYFTIDDLYIGCHFRICNS
jgi:hypothetical protein